MNPLTIFLIVLLAMSLFMVIIGGHLINRYRRYTIVLKQKIIGLDKNRKPKCPDKRK